MTLAKNSKKTTEQANQNGFIPENKMRLAFQAQFAPSKEIVCDENGSPIKGTGLVIFQGRTHSAIEWIENDVIKSVPKIAFVYAVRSVDGSFKNIAQKVSYGWIEGNDLDHTIKGLGGTVVTEKVSQVDNELFGEDFGNVKKLDYATTNESLESFRGKAYTVVLERKVSKKGAYYYDIDIASMAPRLNAKGEHIQALKLEDTDPNAVVIDWTED